MLRKVLVVVALAATIVFSASGCKKRSTEPNTPDEPEVKTMAEYETEAKKEITKENMDEELEKLEKEIEQEIGEGG